MSQLDKIIKPKLGLLELAKQLGGDVTGSTCYDSKNEWKKLTIEYDRNAR